MKPTTCLTALLALGVSSLPLMAAPKIGVLLKDRDVFWGAVQKGVVEASKAANVDPVIMAPVSANSLPQQLKLLGALEKEPLDALVIGPLTEEEFREPIGRLVAKGVKIVALDTPLPEGLAHTYCGYSQKTMAESAARLFASLTKDGDEVAMLRANSIEKISTREKVFMTAVKELHPKSVMDLDVMAGAEKNDDYDKAVLLLERHPGIKAVMTPFSASSMAMIKVLRDRNLVGKVQHVGFGSGLPAEVIEAINAGGMQGWIAQQPKLIGIRGIEAAVDLVNGKKVPPTIDVDYFVVTKDNLNDPKIQMLRN